MGEGRKLANSSVENSILVQANQINYGNIEVLCLDVSLLVSFSRACSVWNLSI